MIEPKYATLRTLFADRVFRIPEYQRFYSWRKKQREDLFKDIRNLADAAGDDHHFMATIVCHKAGDVIPIGGVEYNVYGVVDGQQRLTTLILILKCIHLRLQETGEDADEMEDIAKLLVKRDGNLLLLQANNVNDRIFNSFLRDGRRPERADVETDADKNFRDAITDCESFIDEWCENRGNVVSLLRLIQNRLGFVTYDTENSRIVYNLFEILNSRGLAVDALDKCKSALMGKAYELAATSEVAEATIAQLNNIWGGIYREIAKASVPGEQILRVVGTLRYGSKSGKSQNAEDSLEMARLECKSLDKPTELSEYILDVTKKLVLLETGLFWQPVTRVLQGRVLAVALLSTDCLSDQERARVMEQWERVTFRIFGLFGKDARTEVGNYLRLATKVINKSAGASRYSEIMAALRALGKTYQIDDAITEGLAGQAIYETDPESCRYILWRYEEHLAEETGAGATIDATARAQIREMRASESIEHIFPQNPEPGGAWDGQMHRADSGSVPIEDHVHRIGNLLLLPERLNEEASRQGFREKKAIYDRHSLRMVKQVLSEQQWTLDQIETREQAIIDWSKTAWSDIAD